MFGRIKYRLLCMLLSDLCCSNDCQTCRMDERNRGQLRWCSCNMVDVYKTARLTWGIEKE